MGVLHEIIAIVNELKRKYRYDFNIANLYGIADFRRNEFVFYAKKAIREWIRRHSNEIDRYRRSELVQALNRAIMKLWLYPQLFDALDREVTQLYEELRS